jgi:hypothetical protein
MGSRLRGNDQEYPSHFGDASQGGVIPSTGAGWWP